jgi:hypothetical protein
MMIVQILTERAILVVSLLVCAGSCSSEKASNDSAQAGYTKIDDMEGEGGSIQWVALPGVPPGSWWTNTDCTEGERISPVPHSVDPHGWFYAAYSTPNETFPGITSSHAARLRTTSPLVGIWGAMMGINFTQLPSGDGGQADLSGRLDAGVSMGGEPCTQSSSLDFPSVPVDLSAYSGITFWGMADSAGAKTILVQLRDINTDPRGGICNAADPSTDGACYNGFGIAVALTDTLTQYTIDFPSLQQNPTWGYRPDPSVLDSKHVYGILFEVDLPFCATNPNFKCAGGAPSLTFDFWIDDLYLVNK